MKKIILSLTLIFSQGSFASAVVRVNFIYTLEHTSENSVEMKRKMKMIAQAAQSLAQVESQLVRQCNVSTQEIISIGSDTRIFATLQCSGESTLDENAVAILISENLSQATGIELIPTAGHGNAIVIMSN